MAAARQSHDEFFERLSKLLAGGKSREHGTIFLVQKRLAYGTVRQAPIDPTSSTVPLTSELPYPILVRATDGKSGKKQAERIKLSTVVDSDDLDAFFSKYAEICKAGMLALRPRDRSKRKGKSKKKKTVNSSAS